MKRGAALSSTSLAFSRTPQGTLHIKKLPSVRKDPSIATPIFLKTFGINLDKHVI